jgi:mevalonate kinase
VCMMATIPPTIWCSAPGKVILFGEHAVVHGKTAVAAAVSDLRIVVELVRALLAQMFLHASTI